ncbi:MAG: autotransporter-associated beta strand repeat-containing protein [Gemmataceae bacterium]
MPYSLRWAARATLVGLLLLGSARLATAQTAWVNPFSGNMANVGSGTNYSWSTPPATLAGFAGNPGLPASGSTLQLSFTGLGSSSGFLINDDVTGLTLNRLLFDAPAGNTGAVSLIGNSFTLSGAGAGITLSNDAVVSIANAIAFAPGTAIGVTSSGPTFLTLGGAITGDATSSLTFGASNAAATYALTGNNSAFAGNTTLNAGYLRLGSATALGTGTLTVVGGVLAPTTTASIANNIVLSGAASLNLAPTTGVTATLAGIISGGAATGVVYRGGSALPTGVNTYGGSTALVGGRLFFNSDIGSGVAGPFGNSTTAVVLGSVIGGAFGGGGAPGGTSNPPSDNNATAVPTGAVPGLELNINSASITSFARNLVVGELTATRVTIASQLAATSTVAFSGSIDLRRKLVLDTDDYTYSGNITGPGSLESLTSTNHLTGTGNTFTGGVLITGGTLSVDANSSAGTGPISVGLLGGRLQSQGGGRTFANTIFLSNGVTATATAGTVSTNFFSLGANGTDTAANTFAGTIFGNGLVAIDTGAVTTTLSAANNYIGQLSSTSANPTLDIGTGRLNLGFINVAFGVNYAGSILGSGTGRLAKYGSGNVQEFRGAVSIPTIDAFAGNIRLAGQGQIITGGVNTVRLHAGGGLVFENALAAIDRFPDTLGLASNAGSIALNGNATGPANELIGTLTATGYSTVTLTPAAGAVDTTAITFAALSRTAGGGGTFLFRGTNLGLAPGAGNTNVFFTTAPPILGAGGTGTQLSIMPYAVAATTTTGTGNTFATYTAASGVVPLDLVTGYATYAAGTASDNVRVAGTATGLASASFNSLVIDNSTTAPVTIGGVGGSTIVLGSLGAAGAPAGLLFSGTQSTLINGFSTLDFGSHEAVVFVTNTTTAIGAIISSSTPATAIATTVGLTKAGAGRLILNANSAFVAPVVVAGGSLYVTANTQLGNAANSVLLAGGTLEWNVGGTTTITRPVSVGPGGGTLAIVAGNTTNISGIDGAGSFTKTGQGTLIFTGPNTYQGRTVINGGALRFSDPAHFGADIIAFEGGLGGTLQFGAGGLTLGKDIFTQANGIIDTNGFDGTISGRIFGGSSGASAGLNNATVGLTKVGTGTLTLTGFNPLMGPLAAFQGGGVTLSGPDGSLRLSTGTPLWVNGTLSSTTGGTYIAFGSTLTLDNTGVVANNNLDRLSDYQNLRLHTGNFTFRGNANATSTETLNALVLQDSSFNVVTVTPGTGQYAAVGFTTIGTNQGGAVLFRGTNLGTVPTAGSTTAGIQVVGATTQFAAPALVGGGGLPGSTTVSILPYAIGDTTDTGLGSTFVTFESSQLSGVGIRPLATSEYATAIAATPNSATVNAQNVRLGSATTLTTPATINALHLNGGTVGGSPLAVTSGAILSTGVAATSIDTQSLNLGTTTGFFFVNNALTVSGSLLGANNVSGAVAFTKAGPATLTLSGTNSFSGSVAIAQGTLVLAPTATLNPVSGVTIQNGGTLQLQSSRTIGGLSASINTAALFTRNGLGAGGTLALGANTITIGVNNLDATYAGSITGSGGLVRAVTGSAAAAQLILGSLAHTGPTTIQSGQLTLSGPAGALASTSAINITGGILLLSNADTNSFGNVNNNRLPDNVPVSLTGSLSLTGNANTFSFENIGVLTFTGGSTLTLTPGAIGGARIQANLPVNGLIPRTNRATALVRGTSLGTALFPTGDTTGYGTATFAFLGFPSGTNTVGGTGTAGTTTIPIVPWMVGDTSATGNGATFLTIDTLTAGLRPLNLTTEFATSLPSAGTTNFDNVRLSGSTVTLSGGPGTVGVNSLILAGAAAQTVAGTGETLTLNSGALLLANTAGATINNTVTLDFLGREAVIHTAGTAVLTVNAAINGTGGLTKAGAGTLILGTANTLSGGLTISNGTVRYSADNQLGLAANAITFAGPYLGPTLEYAGTTDLALSRDVTIASGSGTFNVSGSATVVYTLSGNVGGAAGATLVKSGAGILTLAGTNTYLGPTRLEAGTLRFDADSRLGVGGDLIVTAGTLEATGNWTSARTVYANGVFTLNTNANTVVLNGTLTGTSAGTLTKTGTGTLTLAGNNTTNMGVTVAAGTLRVQSSTGLGTAVGGVDVAAGATLELANGITIASAEPISLNGTGVGGAGALSNSSGTNAFFGPVTLTTASTVGVAAGSSLTLYGPMNGAGALTKVGSGTLAIANPAGVAMTGGVAVTAGTLLVNNVAGNGPTVATANSGTGIGPVTVATGATLGGSGSVGGALTLANDAVLSPGNSVGKLTANAVGTAVTFGSSTAAATPSFVMEVSSATGTAGGPLGWDLLTAPNGSLALPGGGTTFRVQLVSLTPSQTPGLVSDFVATVPYTWTFATASGGVANFAATNFVVDTAAFTNALAGTFTVTQPTPNVLALNYTPVPEPATTLFLCGVGWVTFRTLRRARRTP